MSFVHETMYIRRRKIYELLEATAVDIYYRKALMGESIKEFGYLGK